MSDSLFAPPTDEELANHKDDLFAPPQEHELSAPMISSEDPTVSFNTENQLFRAPREQPELSPEAELIMRSRALSQSGIGPSALAGAASAAHRASFGTLDEILARHAAKGNESDYKELRDILRSNLRKAEQAHPVSTAAGNIAGYGAQASMIGASLPASALSGAANYLGDTDLELSKENAPELAAGAAKEAALMGAIPAAPMVAKGIRSTGKYVSKIPAAEATVSKASQLAKGIAESEPAKLFKAGYDKAGVYFRPGRVAADQAFRDKVTDVVYKISDLRQGFGAARNEILEKAAASGKEVAVDALLKATKQDLTGRQGSEKAIATIDAILEGKTPANVEAAEKLAKEMEKVKPVTSEAKMTMPLTDEERATERSLKEGLAHTKAQSKIPSAELVPVDEEARAGVSQARKFIKSQLDLPEHLRDGEGIKVASDIIESGKKAQLDIKRGASIARSPELDSTITELENNLALLRKNKKITVPTTSGDPERYAKLLNEYNELTKIKGAVSSKRALEIANEIEDLAKKESYASPNFQPLKSAAKSLKNTISEGAEGITGAVTNPFGEAANVSYAEANQGYGASKDALKSLGFTEGEGTSGISSLAAETPGTERKIEGSVINQLRPVIGTAKEENAKAAALSNLSKYLRRIPQFGEDVAESTVSDINKLGHTAALGELLEKRRGNMHFLNPSRLTGAEIPYLAGAGARAIADVAGKPTVNAARQATTKEIIHRAVKDEKRTSYDMHPKEVESKLMTALPDVPDVDKKAFSDYIEAVKQNPNHQAKAMFLLKQRSSAARKVLKGE